MQLEDKLQLVSYSSRNSQPLDLNGNIKICNAINTPANYKRLVLSKTRSKFFTKIKHIFISKNNIFGSEKIPFIWLYFIVTFRDITHRGLLLIRSLFVGTYQCFLMFSHSVFNKLRSHFNNLYLNNPDYWEISPENVVIKKSLF